VRTIVASASADPDVAFQWICEVDEAETGASFADSGAFRTLDAKLSAGLGRVLTGDLARQIAVIEEQIGASKQYMKGRQKLWHIYQHFMVSDAAGALRDYRDLSGNYDSQR
jgi:hypothetical protein